MKLKAKDIRDLTNEEIELKAAALKEELYKLRCEAKQARIEKTHALSETRRSLARCYTILKEKGKK